MKRSLILVLFSLCCIFLARHREAATKVKPRSATAFSAENAMDYLKVIAAETHPIGSSNNQKVKTYLVSELNKLGLTTTIEAGHVLVSWDDDHYHRSAYVENVIATLPGSDPSGKKVVLSAHYDSVFEGPGAADDGYAVASMIESVKLLKDQPRKNDIQLIITDGEEVGLLGAQYHVKNHEMDDVGILLNYEARGNEGPCNSFEYSDNNAWLVREMKKSAIRPITSSLSYEIYKKMPNGSDFTAFKTKSVPGINHAFIDGFSYYHNPADNIENISLESIQHTGENMYLMAKHFANYDFSQATKGNASFFNFYGLLFDYPASWDLFLLLLLALVFIAIVVLVRNKKSFNLGKIFTSLLVILVTIVFIAAVNFALVSLVKMFYPQYATFYIYQYYNHEWYFVAGLGLTITILAIISKWIMPSNGRTALGLALILIMSFISLALYFTMPTASFIMLLPALGLGLCMITKLIFEKEEQEGWILPLVYVFFLVGMWTYLSHGLFLAFSLAALPGAVFPLTLMSIASMYLLPSAWTGKGRGLILFFGLSVFVVSLIIAHIKTTPSKKEPLLTNLKYVHDAKMNKTYLATSDSHLHAGHLDLLDEGTTGRLPQPLPYSEHYKEIERDLEAWKSSVTIDTSRTRAYQQFRMVNPKKANFIQLTIPDATNIDSLFLDNNLKNKVNSASKKKMTFTLFGYGLDSLDVKIKTIDPTLPVQLYINTIYPGLPEERSLPEGLAWNNAVTVIHHLIELE